jgi:RNA polymerase-binding transcription factor DksA
MAIKKKPVKAVKKVEPKKVAKPATKKVVAKKAAPVKPVKKDGPKKNTPVVKKTAVSASKSTHAKATVPAKKTTTATPISKKQAIAGVPAKKATAPAHAVKASSAVHLPQATKPVQPGVAKTVKTEDKKSVFKQQVKNTSPVMIKPEPKKAVATTAKAIKVVIPDIKTKTVRKYEPEFTKSVLDIHQQEQTGPTMRYSDSELTEFRELITKKLDSAKKELAYLQGLITRRDEMGGDETDNRYMTMEDGSMSMEREQLSQMASRQITFIDHLEKAMMRIENKTYGICRVTGKLIDKARLKAVPHATLSIEAKQTMNK